MAANKRLFLSLSEEDVARLDYLREELGIFDQIMQMLKKAMNLSKLTQMKYKLEILL